MLWKSYMLYCKGQKRDSAVLHSYVVEGWRWNYRQADPRSERFLCEKRFALLSNPSHCFTSHFQHLLSRDVLLRGMRRSHTAMV